MHFEVPCLLGLGMPKNRIQMLVPQVVFELVLVDTDFEMLSGASSPIIVCRAGISLLEGQFRMEMSACASCMPRGFTKIL